MKDLDILFKRYLENSCNEEEIKVLLDYFGLDDGLDNLSELIRKELLKEEKQALSDSLSSMVARNRSILLHKISRSKKAENIRKLVWTSIAASIILASTWIFVKYTHEKRNSIYTVVPADIEPGTNRAKLVLDNGKSFILSEKRTGITMNGGKIAYNDGTGIIEKGQVQYATLSTPRKGQYQVVLPDGTKVWLNAESSLRYPTAFNGSERLVELKGEGYFEVTHDFDHPFIVQSANQRIKVLGTSFNINAYPDEPHTATTLVTGRILLESRTKNAKTVLAPYQQAVSEAGGFLTKTVDVRPYIAWKDGEFIFRATSLPEAIRQIERWYDLDVDYSNIPKDVKIHALIKRDKKLSSVLYALEQISDVKFKMQGRRLMLMN